MSFLLINLIKKNYTYINKTKEDAPKRCIPNIYRSKDNPS